VAVRSKAWVWGRSFVGVVVSNPEVGRGCLSLVKVLCCQVGVSATGWSLVQRIPIQCGVFECDREVTIMKSPWPTRDCCAMGKNNRLIPHRWYNKYVLLNNRHDWQLAEVFNDTGRGTCSRDGPWRGIVKLWLISLWLGIRPVYSVT